MSSKPISTVGTYKSKFNVHSFTSLLKICSDTSDLKFILLRVKTVICRAYNKIQHSVLANLTLCSTSLHSIHYA